MIYQVIDWIITYIECVVALLAVSSICVPKFSGKQFYIRVFLYAVVNTLLTGIANQISAFSFFTPVLSILCLFVAAGFLTCGSFLVRATAAIMVPFVILSIGYAIAIILCYLQGGDFLTAFGVLMTPAKPRLALLFLDKFADIALYFICRKYLGRIASLSARWLLVLFSSSCVFYGMAQYFFSAILSGEYMRLHRASILSFLVIVLFFVVLSMFLLSISSREKENMQQRLLEKANRMMEQNYKLLHVNLQENAKRLHDFHHHLKAISILADKEEAIRVGEYAHSLLEVSYRDAQLCNSGCDIVDAVINCSLVEAEKQNIHFEYELYLSKPLLVEAVDLCAVLGNQIENAIEACNKVSDMSERYVKVVLTQKNGFFISRVVNSVEGNPFEEDGKLITKKEDRVIHGLGLKSIYSVAGKYNGWVKNSLENNHFTSEVLMCIEQNNT